MRIENNPALRPTAARRKSQESSSASTDFSQNLVEGKPGGPISGTTQLSPVDSLLALQEVDNEPRDNHETINRGRSLLDQLDALRLDLLAGVVPKSRLQRLAAELAARRRAPVVDPNLAAVMAEIELRVAVELAKYEAG